MSRFVLPVASVGEGITPFDGAKLYFYDTGTSNLKDTYSDTDLTVPNTNPVIADADGFFGDIFIADTYKVVLKDKNDVQQYEWDPVDGYIETPTQQVTFAVYENVGIAAGVSITGADTYTWSGGTFDSTATNITINITKAKLTTGAGPGAFCMRVITTNGELTTAVYSGYGTGGGVTDWKTAFSAATPTVLGNTYIPCCGLMGSASGLWTGTITLTKSIDQGGGNYLWRVSSVGFSEDPAYDGTFQTINTGYFSTAYAPTGFKLYTDETTTTTFTGGVAVVSQLADTGTLTSSLQIDGMAEYGNCGQYYLNSGTNNDLIFSLPIAPDVDLRTVYPPLNGSTYLAGTVIRSRAGAANTSAVTASLGTGPVLDVTRADGTPCQASDIVAGRDFILYYSEDDDAWILDNLYIPVGFITSSMILDGTIATADIADGAVTLAKLATGAAVQKTLVVQDQKASGTAGGSSTAGSWQTRVLNTTRYNSITSASLNSGTYKVTLPAGTYRVQAQAPAFEGGLQQIKLYDTTNSADILIGTSQLGESAGGSPVSSRIDDVFTSAGTAEYVIQQYLSHASATNGLGYPVNHGVVEVYTTMTISKL